MHTLARSTPSPTSTWLRRAAGPVLAAALAGGSLFLSAAPASAQTPPSKIAVIDLRRAIAETEQGLRVQATLKKLFDSRQAELESKTRTLQAEKERIDKAYQSGKLSKDAVQKEYEKLMAQDQELQKATVEAQREMQRKEQEMTGPILQGIIEAVKRIAAQEGYEMVLEKSAVPFFRGDLELTDRAIQMYNGGAGTKAPAPPAPKPAPAPAKPPAK
jgi:outer membrane protein